MASRYGCQGAITSKLGRFNDPHWMKYGMLKSLAASMFTSITR